VCVADDDDYFYYFKSPLAVGSMYSNPAGCEVSVLCSHLLLLFFSKTRHVTRKQDRQLVKI